MNRLLLAVLLTAAAASAAHAQPGRLDPAQFDAYFDRPPKVEVNLRGAMLRLAAGAVDEDDDGTGEMLRGLRSILVRVYALDAARAGLADRLASVERDMQASGWSTLVRVRPDGDEEEDDVWVYVRDAGDRFEGMTVVSLDHASGDASFVVIDGPLDPERIGSLGGRFGIPDVDADRSVSDAELERIEAEAERAGEAAEAMAEADAERAEAEAERVAEEAAAAAEAATDRAEADADRAEAEARRAAAVARRSAAEARRAAVPQPPRPPAPAAKPVRP